MPCKVSVVQRYKCATDPCLKMWNNIYIRFVIYYFIILPYLRQGWQYRLELPKLCYHPWMAADEDMV